MNSPGLNNGRGRFLILGEHSSLRLGARNAVSNKT
jgi:hypothetical protein